MRRRSSLRGSRISQYKWNDRAGRYTDAKGRFVKRDLVREELDKTLERAGRQADNLANQLRNREITLGQWETEMQKVIKDTHLASSAQAKGGWAQMTPSDRGHLSQAVQKQFKHLRDFGIDIYSGDQAMDGRLNVRAKLYVEAGRTTHEATARRDGEARGFDEERSILDPFAKHCTSCGGRPGCIEEASKDWQPIGELSLPGERCCLGRCRCTIEQRNSQTEEVRR